MKSPWSFISRVVLRRDSDEVQATVNAENVPEVLPESPASDKIDVVYEEPLLQSMSQGEGDIVRIDAMDETHGALENQPIQAQDNVAPATIEPVKRTRATKPTIEVRHSKGKTPSDRVVLTTRRVKSADSIPKRSIQEETFYSEIVDLDDDIKQLRFALAQKLESQNQQLKRMLSRFDAQ